eukprot:CAMPEP_0117599366 /NCGR_PEP_ID=MMETSP0784-20121206/75911_1 /TAXON_ID=39447 /ORGANISM="" /LENGTH=178 /DNA_ID=CAMNT_0005401917 /DNA_START=135 /DNA_END=668 /DNA_ORIENTATION=-
MLVRCVAYPVQILAMVLFALCSLALLVWFPLMILCCLPWQRCKPSYDTVETVLMCSIVMAYAPFIPFQCVWALCSLIVWTLLCTCGARMEHFDSMVSVPITTALQAAHFMTKCFHFHALRRVSSDGEESSSGEDGDRLLRRGAGLQCVKSSLRLWRGLTVRAEKRRFQRSQLRLLRTF